MSTTYYASPTQKRQQPKCMVYICVKMLYYH